MAEVIVPEASKSHFAVRVSKRYPAFSISEVESYIESIRTRLADQSPADWRFTESPAAKFLVWDESSDFRILGVSYRDSGLGLLRELEAFVREARSEYPGEKEQRQAQAHICARWTAAYVQALFSGTASIKHRLKTVYRRGMDIADVKIADRHARLSLPHVSVLSSTECSKRNAEIPNVVLPEDVEGVWVRQHGVWTAPDSEYDCFYVVHLTERGTELGLRRYYTIDREGRIRLTCICESDSTHSYSDADSRLDVDVPDNLRRRSYWDLPTVVDRRLIDLRYAREHYALSMSNEDWALMGLLEEIVERAKGELVCH